MFKALKVNYFKCWVACSFMSSKHFFSEESVTFKSLMHSQLKLHCLWLTKSHIQVSISFVRTRQTPVSDGWQRRWNIQGSDARLITAPQPDCQRWGVCPAQNAICCPSLRHCEFSAGAALKGTFTQAHTLDVFAIQYFHTQPHHYAGTGASLERACAFTDRQITVRDWS